MVELGLRDKEYRFYGNHRMFYTGCAIESGTAYSYLTFSGTNTGIGEYGHLGIATSGVSVAEWTYTSGTNSYPNGAIYGGEAFAFDGLHQSGLWIRSNANSSVVRVWGW